MEPKKKLFAFSGIADSLYHFRGRLLRELRLHGYDVTAFAPNEDAYAEKKLAELGIELRQIPLDRAGMSMVGDLRFLLHAWQLLRAERPDAVFVYNIKPVIYVSLAARLGVDTRVHALIPGLGYLFSKPTGWKARIMAKVTMGLYRAAISRNATIFFQNQDDLRTFEEQGLVGRRTNTVCVNGSGVDLQRYPRVDVQGGPPVFLLMARLIRDKGIVEYYKAAAAIKRDHPEVRFRLLGRFDDNPRGISEEELRAWTEAGVIEYEGYHTDVQPYIAGCSVYVLPSYYMEGVPRSILEALATGRAVITTNSRGCRETVVEGENGFLVEPRDGKQLEIAMRRYIDNPELAVGHGRASRRLAETKFDVERVNAAMLPHIVGTDHEGPE